jgi:hypothetical protein
MQRGWTSVSFLEQDHALGHDQYLLTDRPDSLSRLGFEIDLRQLKFQQLGDPPDDLRFMGAQFGPLGEHDAIQVVDPPPGIQDALVSQSEHFAGIAAAIGRVVVREQLADVRQRRRTQQGIGDGMQQHVRVAVADQVLIVWDLDSPQP